MDEITIKFYDDTLFYFECKQNVYLYGALNAKYGEAKREVKTKYITCQNNYSGAQINHIENETFHKWRWDKQIKCYDDLQNFYDEDCKEILSYDFYLINLKYSQKEENCQEGAIKKETEDYKNKLNKF